MTGHLAAAGDGGGLCSARKIVSDSELRAIAAAGTGFVADPFNRRWHVATCPHIRDMTVGQPKWFAPATAALDAYLQQRLAQYPTAKPIVACKTCGDGAGVPHAERRAPGGARLPPPIQVVSGGLPGLGKR